MGERIFIIIDGSNFYFKLKDLKLNNLLSFDFSAFIKTLSGNDEIIDVVYYVGRVKTDGSSRSNRLLADQQRLLVHLKQHSVRYCLGYLMKSDGKYHEKGVDVNIAVDILVATYEKTCDRILLISSDIDLLPAIMKARQKGIMVDYIGFLHKPSLALVAKCSHSKLLTKKDISLSTKS